MPDQSKTLEELKRLVETGMITAEEFEDQKGRLGEPEEPERMPAMEGLEDLEARHTREIEIPVGEPKPEKGPVRQFMWAFGLLFVFGIGGLVILKGELGTEPDADNRAKRDLNAPTSNEEAAPKLVLPSQSQVVENTTWVAALECLDAQGEPAALTLVPPDKLSLEAGVETADAQLFVLRAQELFFQNAPDFEQPRDANGDNVYRVGLVCGAESEPQVLQVAVTDVVDESP